MSYTFAAEEKPGFVHVRITGDNSRESVRGYLREVYELCARTGVSSVLIEEDLSGARLEPVEVYRVAVEASADTTPIILRIAYVDVRAGSVRSNVDLGLAVARDRGVNVEAFGTVSEAEAWLSGQVAP
jgi:hypothetical protein